MHFLRGIVHALIPVVGGLNTLKGLGTVPILTKDEERYFKPRKRPLPFGVPEGVPNLRSCVYNKLTKTARFDMTVPENPKSSPLCVFHFDEGPKDLPAFWYLPAKGYRVLPLNDVLHRTSRDMGDAAKASGNWSMVLDTSAALNYDHGPFMSCANFAKNVEAAEDYCKVA